MTWLWHICFSLSRNSRTTDSRGAAKSAGFFFPLMPRRAACALICASCLLAEAPGGTVRGKVELEASRDSKVRRGKNNSGVVVWLEPLSGGLPELPASPRRAEMIQKSKKFIPHVLAVTAGTAVHFPNFDPIFHNAFSNFSGQIFDVGLYPPGTDRTVVFRREGMVRVFCNIHPTMSAIIAVLKTPYFSVSDRDGSFEIAGAPPGEYRMRVFHERATAKTLASLERNVTVSEEPLLLPLISISEVGYLQQPHKNKYGKEYSPVPDEHIVYPGVRK
ncbi:MAG: hypothetical protein ACRD7E_19400 [Bryobacteraceae bacterium]